MQDKLRALVRSGTTGAHNTRIAENDPTVHDVDFACTHRSLISFGALPFSQDYSPALTRPQSKDAS